MIKITIKYNNNSITNLTISGHAHYDVSGKDIVCAAVSSSALTTINGLLSINENYINHYQQKDNLIIKVNMNDNIVEKLLNNLTLMLKELEKEYPKHIKIIEEV